MTDSSATTQPEQAPENTAGELKLILAMELAKLQDAALAEMRSALEYIADVEGSGRWAHVPIDTQAANEWAMMVYEMQRHASGALGRAEDALLGRGEKVEQ